MERSMSESLEASETRPSVQEVLDVERNAVPKSLRETRPLDLGTGTIGTEQYTSRAHHDLEMERMWSRVWQMACREEEIPKVGDHMLYEIGDTSLIIVRSAESTFKALHNSCLHRGMTLRARGGNAHAFKCPFHGFTWNLDGTLKEIPCRWDFPQIADSEFSLPEARVGRWGGFVFVNLDPDCGPLEEYLGPIPEHFAPWRFEERVQVAHVQKHIPANWKAVSEAFMESFHVRTTHPQIMPYLADTNTQYDVYDDHVNRMISMMLVPSPHVAEKTNAQQSVDAIIGPGVIAVPEGRTAREFMGEMWRSTLKESGYDASDATDSELLDAIQYLVFPNFSPWGGYQRNIVYRFLPSGNDPDSCIMEVRLLGLFGEGQAPEPAKLRVLGPDDDIMEATELGALCPIFKQDMANLPRVQQGLRASRSRTVNLAQHQEVRIRHFHQTLEKYLAREA
jgi:phenylpropionate dioxygenase-like ring-hydroxylating dioxygenase large terminal subunit